MRRLLLIISLLAGLAKAPAQTCTGGLGDPIVDITFGSGTGLGAPLAAGITNLTYVATYCPTDGFYTITNQTSGCFGSTWFNVPHDHTGDPNGYFMLINASFNPNDFYVQTVNGLCGNTSYQFAAWVMNVVKEPNELQPKITFSIEKTDGTVLQQYSTGDIPETSSPQWKQFSFYFNTPPGVNSVVLRMTNDQIGGDGNDMAIDDITFRPAGSSITQALVGYSSDSVSFCVNAQPTLTFNATVESCYPSESVQWQESTDDGKTWNDIPGAVVTSFVRGATASGLWLYRLTAAQTGNLGVTSCQVASPPVSVNVIPIPLPSVSIAGPASVCAGSSAVFTAVAAAGGPSPGYQWMVDGMPAGAGADTFAVSTLVNGDAVSCAMTSHAVCAPSTPAVSNAVSTVIVPIPVTGVDIAASAVGICQDSVVVFKATPVNGGGLPGYQWQVNGVGVGGDSAVFVSGKLRNGDVVNCLMTADLACSKPVGALQPVTMVVYPLPVIVLDSAVIIAGGSSIQLKPAITGDIAGLAWTPYIGLNNAYVPDPVASPIGNTTYRLDVITSHGCTATAAETVDVFYDVRMPGGFTPNGDGRNDLFRVPPSTPVVIKQLAVYNRQGEQVFYTTNAGVGWDGSFNGQPAPAGVYVWFIEYHDPLTKKTAMKKGTVVLVR
jgi:gliding motility-associated-like protein